MISQDLRKWQKCIVNVTVLWITFLLSACSNDLFDNKSSFNVEQNIPQQVDIENERYNLLQRINVLNANYRIYAEEFSDYSLVFSDNPIVNEDVVGALSCIPSFGHIGGRLGRWLGGGFGTVVGGVGAIPGFVAGDRLGKIVGAVVGAVAGAYIWSESIARENSTSLSINTPDLIFSYGKYVHRTDPINNVVFVDSLFGSSIGCYHNLIIQEDWYEKTFGSFFESNINEAWERFFAISRLNFSLDFDEEAEDVIYQEMDSEGYFSSEQLNVDVIRENMYNYGLEYEYQIISEFCEISSLLPVYLYKQYTEDFLDILREYEHSSSDMFVSVSIIGGIVSLRMNSFLLWKTILPHPDDYSTSFCFFNNKWDVIHMLNSTTENVFTCSDDVVGIPKVFGNAMAIFFYKEDCVRFDVANICYQSLINRESFTINSNITITNQMVLESLNVESPIQISAGTYPVYSIDDAICLVYINNIYQ